MEPAAFTISNVILALRRIGIALLLSGISIAPLTSPHLVASSLACGDKIASSTILTSDLLNCSQDGLVIVASNVILDCQGHSITAPAPYSQLFLSAGFRVQNVQNVTIENCVVRRFQYGVWAEGVVSNLKILNNTLDTNLYSAVMGTHASMSRNIIVSNLMTHNEAGLNFTSSGDLIYNNLFNNTREFPLASLGAMNVTKTSGKNIIGGPFLGGNFWDDYSGIDTNCDGLGDTQIPNHGDYLPLVQPNQRFGSAHLDNCFIADWADYFNDGSVNIMDLSKLASVFGTSNPYWDLYQSGTVNIRDLVMVATQFGLSFGSAPFYGKGTLPGQMDPLWRSLCNSLSSPSYRTYCMNKI